MRVDVTVAEATWALEYLREQQSENEFEEVRARIRAAATQLASMTTTQRYDAKIPCPLLVDKRCSVYPKRPLKCVGYSSIDVEDCRKGFEEPAGSGTIRADAKLYLQADEQLRLLKQAMAAAGQSPVTDDLIFVLDRLANGTSPG
jgi:Fe-S-cluster containining protein